MKKLAKLLVLTLVLAMVCLSLCSCSYLDTIREERVEWDENGINLIYQGETYRPLPTYIPIEIETFEYLGWVYIVDSEVPLLLTTSYYDDTGYLNSLDGEYLIEVWYDSGFIYYCHEDVYDDYIRSNPL